MEWFTIVNWIYIVICCSAFLMAFGTLILIIINRKKCFNFPTLLVGNSILGALVLSTIHITIGINMLPYGREIVPFMDSFCSFRAYLHYLAIGWVHHSLIIQALEKNLKIRRSHFFDTRSRQIGILVIQWLFDIIFVLPVFLTGNIIKVKFDNICFITLTHLELVIYPVVLIFVVPNIVLATIFKMLVRYVRHASNNIDGNRKSKMQRDLKMVHRVVLINLHLFVVDSPASVYTVLAIIDEALLPHHCMSIFFSLVNLGLCFMITAFLFIVPNLRQSIIEGIGRQWATQLSSTNRVVPTVGVHRH